MRQILILASLVGSLLIGFSATAQEQPSEETIAKLRQLIDAQLPGDIRVRLAQTDQGFCGEAGDFWVVVLQIKKFQADEVTGELAEIWPNVKAYGVKKSEVQSATALKDVDTCPSAAMPEVDALSFIN